MGMDAAAGRIPGSRGQVTVWEADGCPWRGAGYGSELARRLRACGFSVRTVPLQERPPTDDELAAQMHVISGGNSPATTTTGWVGAARSPLGELLERALSGSASVVGICFGAQLLAVSLAGPGAVRPTARGMEVGLHRVRCTTSIAKSAYWIGSGARPGARPSTSARYSSLSSRHSTPIDQPSDTM